MARWRLRALDLRFGVEKVEVDETLEAARVAVDGDIGGMFWGKGLFGNGTE